MYSTELNSDLGSNESLKYQSVLVYFEDQKYEYLTLQGVQEDKDNEISNCLPNENFSTTKKKK